MNKTSLVELFGAPASAITVGSLLRMASGLGVWDTVTFDTMSWTQSRAEPSRVFPPLEFLRETHCLHVGSDASTCASKQMDCRPGCRQYSSANFQVLGLVLLRHEASSGCSNISNLAACSWQNLSVRGVFERSPPERFRAAQFYSTEPLSKWLTVTGWDSAGADGNSNDSFAAVWEENSSVLGGHVATWSRQRSRLLGSSTTCCRHTPPMRLSVRTASLR